MKVLRRLFFITVTLLLLVYIGDSVSVTYRIPNGRQQFGSVKVRRVFAVKLKNQKTEYMFDQPYSRQCVHSLFPRLGLTPCWYLKRHPTEEVDLR